jgi:citrate lyase subunit beta/citryl-CoA lyase
MPVNYNAVGKHNLNLDYYCERDARMQFCFIHEVSRPGAIEAADESGASRLLLPAAGSANDLRRQARARGMRAEIFVAVSPADSDALDAELDALGPDLPDGVVLADCRDRRDLQRLSVKLGVREAQANRPEGVVRILAIAGQSAAGVLKLPDLAGGARRLAGLVYDPGALARDIGVELESSTLKTAMSLAVFAAVAANVPAFLALSPNQDPATLLRRCAQLRRAGYAGAILKTPAQFAAARGGADMIDKRL